MKRLTAIFLMILCLIPCGALAEDGLEPLFPAVGENGKWGYVNPEGTFVIPPQFDGAEDFRGNYAVITVYPETPEKYADRDSLPDCEGVIDRSGTMVVEPVYSFDPGYDEEFYGGKDTGIWWVHQWHDDEGAGLDGFFDIPSGYFSGLVWRSVYPWVSDSRLIPVSDDTYLTGYADRTTGELVIPCRYFGTDPSCFYGGVASVALEDEDGNPLNDEFFLIDETGAVIPLPKGIQAVQYEGAFEGRVLIKNGEELFGFADVQGAVVISPQFTFANRFKNGFAVVQFPEGDWGRISPDGDVLARGLVSDDWDGPDFYNGMYATQTGDHEFSIIDLQGRTVLTFSCENLVRLYPPDENGLCMFETDISGIVNVWQDRKYGFVDLSGQITAEPKPYESD